MNLMFRKNFAAVDKSERGTTAINASSCPASSPISFYNKKNVGVRPGAGGRGTIRRSREFGYYPMEEHPSHAYRTHLFLSPPAGGVAGAAGLGVPGEEGLGGLGSCGRRSSGPLIKWGGGGGCNKRKSGDSRAREASEPSTPTASRQVSFSGGRASSVTGTYTPLVVSGHSPPRGEPVTLATLDRDCFIIPLAALESFLPAGVPHSPIADKRRPGSPLSVLEVEDPKQCVLAHLMTPLEPLDALVELSTIQPIVLQRDTAAELIAELAPHATQSILLTNMERNAEFPFITYYLINKQTTDLVEFYREAQCSALRKFDPRDMRFVANHTLDLFNEVATIARPPLEPPGGRPPAPATGYIVSIFKVFEGDDGLKFEQNWLYWTGARMIYRYLPKSVGLRRITLHKSMSQGDKMYLLICECSQLQDNLSAAAILLPALRARLCGYTGLYRPSICL